MTKDRLRSVVLRTLQVRVGRFIRSVPLPFLSLALGLLCGLLVWLILDQVQPKAIKHIFLSELQARLDQQSREALISYEYFVSSHIVTSKLFSYHPKLTRYLNHNRLTISPSQPILHQTLPSWLPSYDSWESGVEPDYILLFSNKNQLHDIVQLSDTPLPDSLNRQRLSNMQDDENIAYHLMQGGELYLLISTPIKDDQRHIIGHLVLVTLVNQLFLESSQTLFFDNASIVALIDSKTDRLISSSDNQLLSEHIYLEESRIDFITSSTRFPIYDGFNFNLNFVTLTPQASIHNLTQRINMLERKQRLFTSLAFIFTFTVVFFFLSQHINRTLSRLSKLSSRAMGIHQPVSKQGNQLLVLEEWIGKFILRLSETLKELEQRHALEIHTAEVVKEALFESSPDSIITLNNTGIILECNCMVEQTFGYSRHELLGKDVEQTLLLNDQATRLITSLNTPSRPSNQRIEMQGKHQQGHHFPIEMVVQSISINNQKLFTVQIHDISRRKRREYNILCLAKFPGESPSPVLRVSRQGVIIYANLASAPLLYYWEIQSGQTLPTYWVNKISAVFYSGIDKQVEMNCAGRIFTIIFTPIVDLEYVNIYAHEITNERRAEKLAMEHQQELVHVCRLSSMGEMSTGLAHELNQPLAAIGNFANGCVRRLASGSGSKEDLQGALSQIVAQANRAGEIIRRLRTLIGRQMQDKSQVDTNEMITEVCSFMDFQAKKIEVNITKNLYPSPLILNIDLVQIEQVLVNFIRNALDALEVIDPEKRQLIISTFPYTSSYVAIAIEDTGLGINEEVLKHLFDAFFTTKTSGMGMGLAISKTIIEDHKGSIEVETEQGHGCKFTLFLPTSHNQHTDPTQNTSHK